MCNSRGFLAPRKEYSPFSLLRYFNLTEDGQFSTEVFEVSVRRNIFQEIGSFLYWLAFQTIAKCCANDGARLKVRFLQKTKSRFRRLV